MRMTSLVILALTALLPLRADEELKNIDFAEGRTHWEGAGVSASVLADADAPPSISESNTVPSGGLIIKLAAHDWSRVIQEFRPQGSNGTLTITYKLSDDCAFTTLVPFYRDIPDHIGYSQYKHFRIKPGNWIALFIETEPLQMEYYDVTPKSGSDSQTFVANVTGLVPRADKALCLAFPPGTGSVTLLHVSFATTDAAAAP